MLYNKNCFLKLNEFEIVTQYLHSGLYNLNKFFTIILSLNDLSECLANKVVISGFYSEIIVWNSLCLYKTSSGIF